MKRLAIIGALLMVALLPGAANASVTQVSANSCTTDWHNLGDPVPFVCLAQDVNLGGDKLLLTGSSDISNLANVSHDLSGACFGFVTNQTWNDCISSVWAKLGTQDSVCLYRDSGFRRIDWRAFGGLVPAGAVWTFQDLDLTTDTGSDVESSVMLQQSGAICGEGGV